MRFIFFLSLLLVFLQSSVVYGQTDLKLWYHQPARNWNEALPVGNGRLGAMVFGRVEEELIQLNEETLWSGGLWLLILLFVCGPSDLHSRTDCACSELFGLGTRIRCPIVLPPPASDLSFR